MCDNARGCAVSCRYTSCKAFLSTLNEMNDYAGQHEVISENMTAQIMVDLARYVQELKQERKSVRCVCVPWTRHDGAVPGTYPTCLVMHLPSWALPCFWAVPMGL